LFSTASASDATNFASCTGAVFLCVCLYVFIGRQPSPCAKKRKALALIVPPPLSLTETDKSRAATAATMAAAADNDNDNDIVSGVPRLSVEPETPHVKSTTGPPWSAARLNTKC